MLKQHNAKCILSTTMLRNQLQSDMFAFAEKMVPFVKDRCRCCAKRVLSKCITLSRTGMLLVIDSKFCGLWVAD